MLLFKKPKLASQKFKGDAMLQTNGKYAIISAGKCLKALQKTGVADRNCSDSKKPTFFGTVTEE